MSLKAVVDNAQGSGYSKPKTGNRYVAVQLEFANVGATTYSDSPTNGISLIDGSGQVWDTTFGQTTAGPGFAGSLTIAPNDSRVGWVVFELPVDLAAVKIQVALDSGFAEVAGEWKLA